MAAPAANALPVTTATLEQMSDDMVILHVPGTDYRLHLVPAGQVRGELGDRLTGVIRAQARRMDKVPSGGRFVEPVMGRPRHLQGRVIGGDVSANVVYVQAGGVVVQAKLMPAQKAGDFSIGQLVNFSVERGATFEQQA